jgi:hypothetical protein
MEKNLTKIDVIKNLTEEEILSNAIRFALTESPKGEKGEVKDFQKYKSAFIKCTKWLKDNYEPTVDGFLDECQTK